MCSLHEWFRFDEEDFDEDTGSDLSDMSEGDDAGEDMDDDMIMHQYDTEMDEDEVCL